MFLIAVLNPRVPAAGPESLQKLTANSGFTSLGYSMWKTGLEALTKAEKVGQSEYCTHCSLTANWMAGNTLGIMAPAFLRPIARPWL